MTIKNVAAQPVAVAATHVLVILALAMDVAVNQTIIHLAPASAARTNNERQF